MPATPRPISSLHAFGFGDRTAAERLRVAMPSAHAAELNAHDLALLDRLTFGVTPSSAAQFQSMGAELWLRRATASAGRIAAGNAGGGGGADRRRCRMCTSCRSTWWRNSTSRAAPPARSPIRIRKKRKKKKKKKKTQQAYQQAMNDRTRQAAARTILRALYAPEQLRERMTWFWFNPFNVHQYKANLRVLVGDYVDSAIRPHALGRFRDLLSATLHHPAMLRYLDNADNAAGHLNENYAREIMELHTMGVGSGYAQADVEQLARILTGVGIDPKSQNPNLKPELRPQLVRQGLFEFNPARHDYGDKTFLGHTIKGVASPKSTKPSTSCAGIPPPRRMSRRRSPCISSATIRRLHWCSTWRRRSRRPTAISPLSSGPWCTHRSSPPR